MSMMLPFMTPEVPEASPDGMRRDEAGKVCASRLRLHGSGGTGRWRRETGHRPWGSGLPDVHVWTQGAVVLVGAEDLAGHRGSLALAEQEET